jgi:hypothetical protein
VGRLVESGWSRDRQDSPSTTSSKTLFLNRSTALSASRASSKVATQSAVSLRAFLDQNYHDAHVGLLARSPAPVWQADARRRR